MPDDSTVNSSKSSGLNSWVTAHKKSIIVAGILFGAIIVWMIAKHGSGSAKGAVNTTQAANSQIPTYGGPYNGGGEFGGGYASSNNFGQLEQQLASINTTLAGLSGSSHNPPAPGSGTPPAPGTSNTPTPWGSGQVILSNWIPGAPENQQAWSADLNNIAGHYSIPVSSLVAANPQLSDPNRINPGTVINLPNIPSGLDAARNAQTP